MTQLRDHSSRIGVYPPDEELRAAAHAVPGTRITPGVVTALDGPELAGPEVAPRSMRTFATGGFCAG
jgi:hypothetical protein